MIEKDVIIVGGGPAGSSCAWRLKRAGADVLVLDRAQFPRPKLCAGWITPKVVADLEIDIDSYPLSFLTFEALSIRKNALGWTSHAKQHSIRRIEFDDWLLKRSGADVIEHFVKDIRREGERWIIDETYACRHLVGAGGTRCPVYKAVFHDRSPREDDRQVAVLEAEFPYDWSDGTCRLWFAEGGLPGYSWYVPKRGGHINVGLGGMAGLIKARGAPLKRHWAGFVDMLAEAGLVDARGVEPGGYTYYVRGADGAAARDNAYLIGDAAGLATRDLAEGIGPAVESGLAAADSILTGAPYATDFIGRYTLFPHAFSKKPLAYVSEASRKVLLGAA